MSQKKEKQQISQEVTVGYVCDGCEKEVSASFPAWKVPGGWIEIVEYPGYPDADPDHYHLCSYPCFAKFARENHLLSHRGWYEVRANDLELLLPLKTDEKDKQ